MRTRSSVGVALVGQHDACTCNSGKHRSKEPKKNNKQRLRFRAQNQHSDHLASARSSQVTEDGGDPGGNVEAGEPGREQQIEEGVKESGS
ncbi:hypothetical protein AMECASPLE_029417 [Ameca splendens]|uniref:Uncharacterized protein n=1 Tax=Ameca splendens TaxID=208324 RepID=A0ABV0ZQM6_9TELE